MRFDQEVWQRLPVIERMGYTMDCLLDRARRFSDALRAAGVPAVFRVRRPERHGMVRDA